MKRTLVLLPLFTLLGCQLQGAAPLALPINSSGSDSSLETPSYTAEELLPLFTYDPRPPLEIEEYGVEERGGVTIHDLSYVSPVEGWVTAYLVIPSGQGPFAAILYQHWAGGDRSQFLEEALRMAEAGAVCLLVDAPFARPPPWRRTPTVFSSDPTALNPELDRQIYIQTVVDLRRGVDLLVARPDVDPERVGFVGHSYGATFGGVLAGVEPRIKAFVLMAASPGFSIMWRSADTPEAMTFRSYHSEEAQARYLDIIAPLDAIYYIGQAMPSALLFQFGRQDTTIPQSLADLLYQAASEPKQIVWYEAGHLLDVPQARVDRMKWLSEQLNLEKAAP